MTAVIDTDAPPLNDRGMIDLVSPKRGLRVLLGPDVEQYLPNGGVRRIEAGPQVRFDNHRAECPPELWAALCRHPAYTGEGEPKIVFLNGEHAITGAGGVVVIDGPMSADSSARRQPPPLVGWDQMTDSQISQAVRRGHIRSPLDALVYERLNRARPGVILLLAAAVAGSDLPNANQMKAATRKARADELGRLAGEQGDGLDDDDEEEPLAPMPTDADIDDELERAIAEAGGDIDVPPDASEPAPGEGVR